MTDKTKKDTDDWLLSKIKESILGVYDGFEIGEQRNFADICKTNPREAFMVAGAIGFAKARGIKSFKEMAERPFPEGEEGAEK